MRDKNVESRQGKRVEKKIYLIVETRAFFALKNSKKYFENF